MGVSAAADLRNAVSAWTPRLLALSPEQSAAYPAPGKWSPREIIGHLVDSASNNHQRFVRAALSHELMCLPYAQDAWVSLQRYQDAPWPELVQLWQTFNLHLARIVDALPDDALSRPRERHNLPEVAFRTPPDGEPATLGWFVDDYVAHLHHHLAQVEAALSIGTSIIGTSGHRGVDTETRSSER